MNPPGLEQKLRLRALRFSWIKDVVQAVAFTAAGIWAIYTFWYREKYLPRVTEANLSAHVQVERLGEKDGTQALRIMVTMDNPGPATARILGSTIIARGIRVLRTSPPDHPRPAPNAPLEVGSVHWIDRTLDSRPEVLFNSVGVPESFDNRTSSTVRPGGRNEEETVLFLQSNSYPYVTVEAQVAWLPEAFALRKECYALISQEDGSIAAAVRTTAAQGAPPGACRLTTTTASATIALR